MADPYRMYAPSYVPSAAAVAASAATIGGAGVGVGVGVGGGGLLPLPDGARPNFPGFVSSEASFLASQHLRGPTDILATSSDYLQRDVLQPRPGAYGLEGFPGLPGHAAPRLGGLPPGGAIPGYPNPLEDPALVQRRDLAPQGITQGTPDIINERPGSVKKVDGVIGEESSILFVDGLPNDCTRREVAHLFRPFIGFKEIRLVHKEPRHSREKALVLCFVEFTDEKCALTAMEALQDYKFDEKKPDAPSLRIQFAHFPFRQPVIQPR